ncbi:MAG TPA: hypothetical protein VFJ43_05765 [Bacteroidia bacterium]|nr:hypothetical protein [Bacteroidia bacterium]
MKTLVVFLSLITLLATSPANAQAMYVADNAPQIFTKIQHGMHVPENMKNSISSERVRVVFTIDETGKAHVVDISTRRPDMKESVTSQFEAIDFSDIRNPGNQEYSIWLTFKVI